MSLTLAGASLIYAPGAVREQVHARCISVPIIGLSGTIDCMTTYFEVILAVSLSLLDQLALALPSTLAWYCLPCPKSASPFWA